MNNSQHTLIPGGIAKDERGQIRFVNDFDMSEVKRFYLIKNADLQVIRGWRGHKIEQRWFYVISGAFRVNLVEIDDWVNPSPNLPIKRLILTASEGRLLYVPAGYATAFQAAENNAELLVYADYGVEHAPLDDHIWPSNYFQEFS
ncbi:WxcM-like domain-containing protein [Sphingobacterium sp. lm-10]|uniref:WxcM-like domain-containing protein n=1 Tax=Sphingobacterium sp. lm-10 TaxID=2944904 RepID=UPI0020227127|nr:WxcM-like domain-containing protein [Sphingobacterium sp. lm-10]MCL7988636.1 WxcM-like domain-containing protein [Sphingobacterium sp. lm-10]